MTLCCSEEVNIDTPGLDPQQTLVTVMVMADNPKEWKPHEKKSSLWDKSSKTFIKVDFLFIDFKKIASGTSVAIFRISH